MGEGEREWERERVGVEDGESEREREKEREGRRLREGGSEQDGIAEVMQYVFRNNLMR